MRNLLELNRYRNYKLERNLWGMIDDEVRSLGGAFNIPTKGYKNGMKVIASSGMITSSKGWDHVSISLPNRCPSWEEMCKVKNLFFHPNEVCFQLHPEETENISVHKYCLHIWRNINFDIPLPPPEMVGVKGLNNIKDGTLSIEFIRETQEKALADIQARS